MKESKREREMQQKGSTVNSLLMTWKLKMEKGKGERKEKGERRKEIQLEK